ncbi:AAA family ATPase [Bradyrhizobium campsiandrae]|uniref:AAA family ATPase n=2 Tax=Bradyrhizobium campsiandrae TaxID=1729892 RepID=A0ABR7U6L7_9BRAD|nr:adenylate/guanylate cyclase domain-containing protein [Bradyrhizobium campsiandrae]MBC9979669.1 AAA family ATPase [Bradyrhizobium campsiandrae]
MTGQVAAWLEKVGLPQYLKSFSDHGIDFDILSEITDRDLATMGVMLGHRRRLLRSIAELDVPKARPLAPMIDAGAERRQLTILFCDLVGSTALSQQFDPEEMRGILQAYREAATAVIAGYDGIVSRLVGDGILSYFGYPSAHEDDAERAVRAGLEISTAVQAIDVQPGLRLEVRIGIATGLVVVGDLIAKGASSRLEVIGETPNLAARMQTLADPGSVVIAASTRRLLGNLFQLRALGTRAIKGFSEPVDVWAVERASPLASRFEAYHAAGLAGFVGREQELARLAECKQRAWRGHGQVVLISGEPGIGKSRLSEHFLSERVGTEPHIRLRYQCSPHHRASALYPVITQLQRAARIGAGDSNLQRLRKLEALLGRSDLKAPTLVPLFADLLSIATDGHYAPLDWTPQQLRRNTLAALIQRLQRLCTEAPVVCIVEDLHWADASSLELLHLVVRLADQLRLLLVLTFRDEFKLPWMGPANLTTLELGRLKETEVQRMIADVIGSRAVPSELVTQIATRTDGVPLFVEELTRTVLELGVLEKGAGGRYRIAGSLPRLSIPTTLQDSLMARLDRLGPAKEVAQICAVIGREFSDVLLRAIADRDDAELDLRLAQLEGAELIFRNRSAGEGVYVFKHALVQNTAYESLLRSSRRRLHERIAAALQETFTHIAAVSPEIAAHHFTQAGLVEDAVEWWGKAGDRSLRSSAYPEAIAHLTKAIGLAEGLSESPAGQSRRLQLQIAYGNALIATRGYGAPETSVAFARARELASGLRGAPERFAATYGLWVGSLVRSELGSMQELAQAFLEDTADRPDAPEAGIAHRVCGMTRWFEGNFVDARRHLEQALTIYRDEHDRNLAFLYGHDYGIAAAIYLALVLWPLGAVDRAEQLAQEAIRRAADSGHVATMVYTHFHKIVLEAMRGNPKGARPHVDAVIELSREHSLLLYTRAAKFWNGWIRCHLGEPAAGLREMEESIALPLVGKMATGLYVPLTWTLLAEAKACEGRFIEALAILDEQLLEVERTGQEWFTPEIQRRRGELLLRKDSLDIVAAETAFTQAMATARAQQTATFELRAALSLARLYQASGTDAQARSVLGPVLGMFTGAQGLPEIFEARAAMARSSTTGPCANPCD